MNDKLVTRKATTVVTTGQGTNKSIIAGKPQVSSQTGKVRNSGNSVDVVFVFDTTGSMDDKIQALLETCAQFVEEAGKMQLDPQFSLISFGDISVQGGGDRIELVVSPTTEIERVKYGLAHIPRNNGFGNDGESCLEAVQEAFKLQYRQGAVKVLILITDEPALQHHIRVGDMIRNLAEREFLVFVVAIDEPYYREMAARNGGVWKRVGANTDLSEILEAFREIAKKVSQIAKDVHLLGKGSVKEYLKLKPPS